MTFGAEDIADAIVVGGGFYGASIATYLMRERGFRHVILIERETALLTRASFNNQARVHNGYHYPRSFTTAYRSRVNLPRFVRDWPQVVKRDFTKVYAIARRNSRVTSQQFIRFCREIGAEIQPADASVRGLFESRLIEDVFLVQEYAFDATQLARCMEAELDACGVIVCLDTQVIGVNARSEHCSTVSLRTKAGDERQVHGKYLFNCTYSGLNHLGGEFKSVRTRLKQEVTEMALMAMPSALDGLGITVMDGPFFSLMPFPARNLHTLSHVRYTPHLNWQDECGINPYEKLHDYPRDTRVDRMVRDVGRYLPAVFDAKYMDSLFEVKTVLAKNEGDDGRPILFEKHPELLGCYSVLGGKIDNIYDILEKLDSENLMPHSTSSTRSHE